MNELATAKSQAVTLEGSWGTAGATKKDLVLPRIHLMQAISEFVKKRHIAKEGDIVDSMTEEVLANAGGSIEMVPFYMTKDWLIHDKIPGQQKPKYRCKVPVTPENEDWPREGRDQVGDILRIEAINVFFMRPEKIDELPYMVTFKSTGYPIGKKIATHFLMCEQRGLPPASQVFSLGSQQQVKGDNEFAVYTLRSSRATTKEELEKCFIWFQTLQKADVAIKASDEVAPVAGAEVVGDERIPF